MKRIFVLLISTLSLVWGYGQVVVMLQHQGSATPFYGTNGFQQAYEAAVPGDSIYLSGGFFAPVNINKRIAVFGAGHHPDSSAATLPTIFTGGISLIENADSCFLTGFRVKGDIVFEYWSGVSAFVLSRLFVEGSINSSGQGPSHQNGSIRECTILGQIDGSRFKLCNVVNNIIMYRILSMQVSMIANNIFLGGDNVGAFRNLYSLNDCVVRNNIFYKSVADFPSCVNNQFSHNIFQNTPPQENNVFSGNYFSVNTSSLFMSYNGSDVFNYSYNFHLSNPGAYPGTDATQVGLYGSLMPWKEGSIPLNPHIQEKTIAENTNSNGQIQVQIKVAAQNN